MSRFINYDPGEDINGIGPCDPLPEPKPKQPKCDLSFVTSRANDLTFHMQAQEWRCVIDGVLLKTWPRGNLAAAQAFYYEHGGI